MPPKTELAALTAQKCTLCLRGARRRVSPSCIWENGFKGNKGQIRAVHITLLGRQQVHATYTRLLLCVEPGRRSSGHLLEANDQETQIWHKNLPITDMHIIDAASVPPPNS